MHFVNNQRPKIHWTKAMDQRLNTKLVYNTHAQLFSTSMQMLSRSPDFQTNQRAIRPRCRSRTNRIEVSSIVFISMMNRNKEVNYFEKNPDNDNH